MRKKYDAELEKWKAGGVKYNSYTRYHALFDRHIPWQQKSHNDKASAGKKKKGVSQ